MRSNNGDTIRVSCKDEVYKGYNDVREYIYLSRLFVDLRACIAKQTHLSFRKQLTKSQKENFVNVRDLRRISSNSQRPGSQW